MRGGVLPPSLLFAAMGLALSFAPVKVRMPAIAIVAVLSLATQLYPFAAGFEEPIFLACWVSVIITAACVHLPSGISTLLALSLASATGLAAGAVSAIAGTQVDLVMALPWLLLVVPGGWLVSRGRSTIIKIFASWLIAIGLLAAALPLTPTPGYVGSSRLAGPGYPRLADRLI
jgi:hypothetical protein